MRVQVTTIFEFLLLFVLTAVADDKIYAPLPDKVVAAKTVFFVNESGTAKVRKWTPEEHAKHKRRYRILPIPHTVFNRVIQKRRAQ